jgi:hypothetical protein
LRDDDDDDIVAALRSSSFISHNIHMAGCIEDFFNKTRKARAEKCIKVGRRGALKREIYSCRLGTMVNEKKCLYIVMVMLME